MKKCVRTIADGSICAQPVSNGNVHPLGSCRVPRQRKLKVARFQTGDLASEHKTQERIHKVSASSKADRKTKPVPNKAA